MKIPLKRRAVSPVVAQIMLAASVLTIGGFVWHFTNSYSSTTADSYVDETMENIKIATERFSVELSANNSAGTEMYIWVNNYGDVDITVDVYASSENRTSTYPDTDIAAGKLKEVTLDFSGDPIIRNEDFAIKVYSRRQNSAYSIYAAQ